MKNRRINFNVDGILSSPKEQWEEIRKKFQGKSRTAFRQLDVDWKKYNTKDFLFTHDTACCSVETEKNGYWITPPCWELVNANGNAWTSPVLLSSFRTFVGGDNFLEHCQLPALSKGKILDAIIRPVKHHSEKYGDANIYVVDLLVATDRKHTDLIDKIESGKLNTLSMGTLAEVTQCSICGKKINDGEKNCEHLSKHIGEMVKCSDGKERMCSELCGAMDDNGNYIDGSNSFIEISWVATPAFKGAVLNAFVETEEEKKLRIKERDELQELFNGNLFERLKVADTETNVALNVLKKISKEERIAKRIMED